MKNKTEFERMQEFAGLKPTKKSTSKGTKQQLDENIGGIVGIGAINNPLEREKPDYELAFEHYVGNHLAEDARTDAEEEGYLDGMRDEKEDLGEDARTDAEEEGYLDGMKDEEEDLKEDSKGTDEDYLRSLINKLDGINSEIKEMLEDLDLSDEPEYSGLYQAVYNIETEVTDTQSKLGYI